MLLFSMGWTFCKKLFLCLGAKPPLIQMATEKIAWQPIIVSTDESVDTMDLTLLRRVRRRRSV